MVTQEMVDCWRVNYGLDKRTPEDAMRYWAETVYGCSPAGAVAALGLVLEERDQMRLALMIAEAALADIGDSDREPGDDTAWCERRAARALPAVRGALTPNVVLSGARAGDGKAR